MKILFFLTLLANLVFFLWQYNAGGFHRAEEKTEISNPEPKQIWLLSELPKKPPVTVAAIQTPPLAAPAVNVPQPAKNNPQVPTLLPVLKPAVAATASATPTTTATAVKQFYCYQIKGFSDKSAAMHWSQKAGVSMSLRFKEIPPVVADYVVNYPVPTPAKSGESGEFLKQHGIKNFFVINHGESKGSISLGVFKSEAHAIKAQRMFIQKGINAKIAKRYKASPAVLTQLKTEQNRSQLLASLAKYTRHPKVESLSQCE